MTTTIDFRDESVIAHAMSCDVEELLERSLEVDALADVLASVTDTGRGRLVLVAGEAGIGKTALVRAFCSGLGRVRVLSGACEALFTARPLGPLLDIAAETRGELAELVEGGAGPSDVLTALLDELRGHSPTVVVLEDLHWADEATLDLIRLLARRIATVPALFVVTYRGDELERGHSLRIALGELPQAELTRLALEPLSVTAVAALARPYGADPDELHGRTAGNPFYVTEALAAGGAALPAGVREAVLARAARLPDGARTLLEAAAIVPPRAELWLLEALAGGGSRPPRGVPASGCCVPAATRRLSPRDRPRRRRRSAAAGSQAGAPPPRLSALADAYAKGSISPVSRITRRRGRREAVRCFACAAGTRAAALGAHREAAAQFARALRLPTASRARSAPSCSSASLRVLPDLCDRRGNRRATGCTRRAPCPRRPTARGRCASMALSPCVVLADNATAEAEGRRAVELLEELPPSRSWRWRTATWRTCGCSRATSPAPVPGWTRDRAAEQLDEADPRPRTQQRRRGRASRRLLGRRRKLARSLALALARVRGARRPRTRKLRRCRDQGGRLLARRPPPRIGDRILPRARPGLVAPVHDRMEGALAARSGRWDDAAAAAEVLDHPHVAARPGSRLCSSSVCSARRGDADPWDLLDEALALAEATGELRRLAPVAAARAEARWLADEPELVAAETERALALAVERTHAWAVGELCVWRRRAGTAERTPSVASAGPFRLELAGEPEAASRLWQELGCPYEAALVLVDSMD